MTTSLMPLPKQHYSDSIEGALIGGKVYTYEAGTTNPKATYSDSAGTIAQLNPIILNARGEPPNAIFWDGSYKVVITDANDVVIYTVDNYNTVAASFIDRLITSIGSTLIGWIQAGVGAVLRTVQDKLRDEVSPRDFGAVGNGVADDTLAVQRAINTGKTVVFNDGSYSCSGLTQSANDQRFIAKGNVVILKRANGVLLTATGRAIMFQGIKFDGATGFTGDCVVTTGDNVVFDHCSVWTTSGIALRAEGQGTRITGTCDIYYSADAAGWAIQLGNASADTRYHQIIGVITSTSVGGIKFVRANTAVILGGQIGTLDLTNGQAIVVGTRIVGNYIAYKAFNMIDNCLIAGNVTIGDGINSVSGMGFGSHNFMQSGTTLTLNALVRESSISTGQLLGVTIVDNLSGTAGDVNNLYDSAPKAYTPTWTADGGTQPVLNNGTLTGRYIRTGRTVRVSIRLTIGSTTNTGIGNYTWTIPIPAVKSATGTVRMFDAGLGFRIGIAAISDGASTLNVLYDNGGTPVRHNGPFIWAVDDQIWIDIEYEV